MSDKTIYPEPMPGQWTCIGCRRRYGKFFTQCFYCKFPQLSESKP